MLIEIFTAIGLIGYGAFSAIKEGAELTDNMNEARAKRQYWYRDPNGKKRAIGNREPIFMTVHNHHLVDMGAKTMRIYCDFTQEKANKANEQLKAEGKKWFWVDYHAGEYKPYDPKAGKFFTIRKGYDGKSYLKCFLNNWGVCEKSPDPVRLSADEVKAWEVPASINGWSAPSRKF